jgi:hypothetical protein
MDISNEDVEELKALYNVDGIHLTDAQAREEAERLLRMVKEVRAWFEKNPHSIQWPSWLRDPQQVRSLRAQLLNRVKTNSRSRLQQVDSIYSQRALAQRSRELRRPERTRSGP